MTYLIILNALFEIIDRKPVYENLEDMIEKFEKQGKHTVVEVKG